ncbi:MAG TPA: serine/threonine-protein kinase [Actinocatenispora sp.]
MNGVRAEAVLAGRYRLRRKLGSGGMSVVWQAYDRVLERQVAVKLLTGAGNTERIRDEARAVAKLVHPHVVNVFDYAAATGPDGTVVPFVVMELVDGATLEERLDDGPPPWPTAVRIAGEVASALAAAHALGIVHRDVTSRNVLLTEVGAKVVDFGISATAGSPDSEPGANTIVGTPAYLSPERLAGLPVEPSSDVYSLGVLLHVLLTGDIPFAGATTGDLARSHWYGPPAPLPAIPGLPPEVDRLRRRCLAKRAKDRPSATELASAFARLSAEAPAAPDPTDSVVPHGDPDTSTREMPAVTPHVAPRRPRSRLFAVLAAVVVVAAGTGVAAALLRPHPHPATPGAAAATTISGVKHSPAATPTRSTRPSRSATRSVAPSPAASPAAAVCRVTWAVLTRWDSGYSASIRFTPTGSRWTLGFSLPQGQRIASLWNGTYTQQGRAVTVHNAQWDDGGAVVIGLIVDGHHHDGTAGGFTLDGTACRG